MWRRLECGGEGIETEDKAVHIGYQILAFSSVTGKTKIGVYCIYGDPLVMSD